MRFKLTVNLFIVKFFFIQLNKVKKKTLVLFEIQNIYLKKNFYINSIFIKKYTLNLFNLTFK